MSIEVNNISKSYGAQKALDNISFSITKGEIVGFLGPNGAGKSTILQAIAFILLFKQLHPFVVVKFPVGVVRK